MERPGITLRKWVLPIQKNPHQYYPLAASTHRGRSSVLVVESERIRYPIAPICAANGFFCAATTGAVDLIEAVTAIYLIIFAWY